MVWLGHANVKHQHKYQQWHWYKYMVWHWSLWSLVVGTCQPSTLPQALTLILTDTLAHWHWHWSLWPVQGPVQHPHLYWHWDLFVLQHKDKCWYFRSRHMGDPKISVNQPWELIALRNYILRAKIQRNITQGRTAMLICSAVHEDSNGRTSPTNNSHQHGVLHGVWDHRYRWLDGVIDQHDIEGNILIFDGLNFNSKLVLSD